MIMSQFCDLPQPAVNIARRLCQLAAQGDGMYQIQLAFINGEWWLTIDGGRLEKLGKVDHAPQIMVR